jgi:hypothetical protein
LGAVVFFMIYTCFKPVGLWSGLKTFKGYRLVVLVFSSILGTFVALSLVTEAFRVANLASIASIAITASLSASLFECIIAKKWPSRWLIVALLFMGMGLYIFMN